MNKLRILITGGAGFIGSNIADEYIRLGHKVTVIDNLSSGKRANINNKCGFHKIDINSGKLDEIFRKGKFDVVNHHAAQINPRTSIANPVADAETNIKGTIKLLQLSVKYKVRKFIFASSGGAVYGEQAAFPASEEHPLNPISPYGISKLSIEKYLDFYKCYYGLDFVALRYSNVYGPRQSRHGESGVISIFIGRILEGKSPVINGSGRNTRDFVFVKDVASANVLALNYKGSGIFNISSGKEISIQKLTGLLIKESGLKVGIKHAGAVKGEQKRSLLSNRKAKNIFGWKPAHDIEKGIKITFNWFNGK